jgi:hypothetical protein
MGESLAPVPGLDDHEALSAEHPCGCVPNGLLVVHEKDAGTSPTRSRETPSGTQRAAVIGEDEYSTLSA